MKNCLFILFVLLLNSWTSAQSVSFYSEDSSLINEQYEFLYAAIGSDPSEEDMLILEFIAKSALLTALESSHNINEALGLEYLPYNEQRIVAFASGLAGFYLTTKGLKLIKRGVNFVGLSKEYRRYKDLIYRMQNLNKQIDKLAKDMNKQEQRQHNRNVKLERRIRKSGLEESPENTAESANKTSRWRRMIPFMGNKTPVPEIPNKAIGQLNVSQATIAALKSGGIYTYSDLALMTKADLADIPRVDSRKINTISAAFAEEGYRLVEEAPLHGASKGRNGFIESEKLTQLKTRQQELDILKREFQASLATSKPTGFRRLGRGLLRGTGLTAIGIAGVFAYGTIFTDTFVILVDGTEELERIRDRYQEEVFQLSQILNL